MYITKLCAQLFPNGGEAYTYGYLRDYLESAFGLSARQVAGVIGAGVRYGFIYLANRNKDNESIFVR